MRHILLTITMLLSLPISSQTLQWGDQGDGTYINPILPSDYSDPDVIRVGGRYYMVASDFHYVGMQILVSDDLVNWSVLTHIYDGFHEAGWDTNSHYAKGSWAPSIRYHNGMFYVFFCSPETGLYMTKAAEAAGPWSPLLKVVDVKGWEDPCPFWDDDGKAYLGHSLHGAGPIIVHRMSDDGTQILDTGKVVYRGPVAEGTKFYKRDGIYYLFIPEGGVGEGWQTALRADNIYGPYERRIVMSQGSTAINGPHQGALVETPEGELWFIHYQLTIPLGRVVHLQPARWIDGWPVTGRDIDGDGVGEPVYRWRKPDIRTQTTAHIETDDDFTTASLKPIWQWNHDPEMGMVETGDSLLTLHAMAATTLKDARNTLTQKLIGYEGHITVSLDTHGMADGQRAGLAAIGRQNHEMGVMRDNGQLYAYEAVDGKITWRQPMTAATLTLMMDSYTKSNIFIMGYDDSQTVHHTAPFAMEMGHWKGVRCALFSYNTLSAGGKASFSHFKYDVVRKRERQKKIS